MKCLIIAAGKGSRLKPRYSNKPLAPLLGVPLIERVIRTALSAGVDDFYVVTGHRGAEVSRFLEQLSERCRITVKPIHNNEWDRKQNGLSVLKAKPYLSGNFLLMMADHIFDPALPGNLLKCPISDGDIILAVDRNVNKYYLPFDISAQAEKPIAFVSR